MSFDAEGTLASHRFSRTIWQGAVPGLYGEKHGLGAADAAERVNAEYATVGPERQEWFDIGYWFRHFELGDASPVIEAHRPLVFFYPDVVPTLDALKDRFTLVVASSTPQEFLRPLLRDIEPAFERMFSSTTSCGRLKDEEFFRWMCREMGAEPSEVVHIGDHLIRDYESALAAGIVSFHLDRSGESGASFHSLAELVTYLSDVGSSGAGEDLRAQT